MSRELNIIEAINIGKQAKFKMIRKNGFEFEVYLDCNNCLKYTIDNDIVYPYKDNINAKFILIQKQVSFMEAVKAFSEGKIIECELNEKKFIYGENYKKQLINSNDLAVEPDQILNGKWYIKEELVNEK